MVRRQSERGEIEIVWTFVEESLWVYRKKVAEDGAARQEENRTAKEEV